MMKFSDIKFNSYLDGVSARINFGHLNLSVVKHSGSYGGTKGLYEIGMFDETNNNMIEMPGITVEGDTVKGFLSEHDVEDIIKKLEVKTGPNPVLVEEDDNVSISSA